MRTGEPVGVFVRPRDPERVSEQASGYARGGDLFYPLDPQTGDPLALMPWQTAFLDRFDRPGVRVGVLSVPRAAGKTTFAALIAARTLLDPASRNIEVGILSGSAAQGRVLFRQLRGVLGVQHGGDAEWRSAEHVGGMRLERIATGAVARVFPADARRLHGAISGLWLLDEPAQWTVRGRDAALSAVETGLGKLPGSRVVALGTQSADSDSWWHRWCNGDAPPGSVVEVHAAGAGMDPACEETWHAANPSLRHFPHLLAEYRAAASDLSPSRLPAFENLRLNRPVADHAASLVVDAGAWGRCGEGGTRDGWYALGVDLSGSGASWTGLAAYWPSTGRIEAFAVVPSDPPLSVRERADAVPDGRYGAWAADGLIVPLGGRSVSVPEVLEEAQRRWGRPRMVSADSFRRAELEDGLRSRGWPRPFIPGGPAARDDLATFRTEVEAGRLRPSGDPEFWRSQIVSARTVVSGGFERLGRGTEGGRSSRARDDVLAAAIRAVSRGLAGRRASSRPVELAYRVIR